MGGNWKKKNQTIKTTKRGLKIDQSQGWGGIKYSWDLQKNKTWKNDAELLKLILPELLLEYHLVNTKVQQRKCISSLKRKTHHKRV
jgi:hypothetical protein